MAVQPVVTELAASSEESRPVATVGARFAENQAVSSVRWSRKDS